MKKYLAIDIGGTFVKYGMISDDAKIQFVKKIKTPTNLEDLLAFFTKLSTDNKDIAGIAISSPGAVSDDGVIYGSSAIPYLHGPNLKKLISERTGYSVHLDNDANCAGNAEMWKGAGKDKKDVLVMVIGTGIGGAVFKNRELHRGANLHGGEFGYMLLTNNVTDSNDIWSRVASTKALVKKVACLKRVNCESLTGEAVFQMAEAGDTEVQNVVNEFYHLLAVGIYNLQYIYDPEVILIGGGISAREDIVSKIDEQIDSILQKIDLAKIKPTIKKCTFAQNANLLGAVYGFISG